MLKFIGNPLGVYVCVAGEPDASVGRVVQLLSA